MACRVDFYVQAAEAPKGHLTLACRVTEKAYQAGHRIYLRCEDAQQANELDELLWTFSQSSFVPHQILQLLWRHSGGILVSDLIKILHHAGVISFSTQLRQPLN